MSPISDAPQERGAVRQSAGAGLPPTQKQYNETMPKLTLEPNSRIFVRFNPLAQKSQPMQGEFLGMSHYDFLIIRLPSVPGLLPNLVPRSMLELRFFLSGAVHTCHTEIITHTTKPALLLYTTYPDRLNVQDIRKDERLSCALPIIVNSSKGDARGIISDLSLGGCRICLELTGQSGMRGLEVGEEIILQTVLNADGMPSGGAAHVRSVEITGSRLSAGLSFVKEHKGFLDTVDNYLKTISCLLPGISPG